ncbi:hypothetical protein [Longitalea luteola]|uniref:hypothetical protein n=1 Tax=Longitalea luteola TaxID=2812563 RepID=UPI001A95A386|nr:hypothetical protein [Longitalea luteola]
MWWNRKKKQENGSPDSRSARRLTSGVSNYVTEKQTKIAGFLNRKTEKLSAGGKKAFLFAVCLLFGGMSLYLVVKPFWRPSAPDASIKPKAISVPEHANKTGDENLYPRVLVTEADIKEVRDFKRYTDSLKNTANGRSLYDSILRARPGLMDTVGMLEELYLLQQK